MGGGTPKIKGVTYCAACRKIRQCLKTPESVDGIVCMQVIFHLGACYFLYLESVGRRPTLTPEKLERVRPNSLRLSQKGSTFQQRQLSSGMTHCLILRACLEKAKSTTDTEHFRIIIPTHTSLSKKQGPLVSMRRVDGLHLDPCCFQEDPSRARGTTRHPLIPRPASSSEG